MTSASTASTLSTKTIIQKEQSVSQVKSYSEGSLQLTTQLLSNGNLHVSSLNNDKTKVITNVSHYCFVTISTTLLDKFIVLCVVRTRASSSSSPTTSASSPTSSSIAIEFYKYCEGWSRLNINEFSFNYHNLIPMQVVAEDDHQDENFIEIGGSGAQSLLISGTEDHFCVYIRGTQSVYLFNVTLKPNNQISLRSVMQLDVFASVYSLLITYTHVIIGKVNCIHLFNWRLLYKHQSNMNSSTLANTLTNTNAPFINNTASSTINNNNNNTNNATAMIITTSTSPMITKRNESVLSNERMGRAIYLPKITVTKEAKKNINISQQTNEQVIDIQLYNNNKILLRSNVGNLFALHCLMPFEKDNLVQLFPSATISEQAQQHSTVTNMDVRSEQFDPLESGSHTSGGNAVVVIKNSTVLVCKMKPVFDAIEQPVDSMELQVAFKIDNLADVQHVCMLTADRLLVISKKNKYSFHNISDSSSR